MSKHIAKSQRWTKPYHGVSHLEGTPNEYQVSLTEYSSFVEVSVIVRRSPGAFSELAQAIFNTVNEARAWGEQQHFARSGISNNEQ